MLKRHWPDAAIIASITIVIGLISKQWAGMDTPDSGFYFSLANFGSQVTDRAPIDSYYWTRLGVIGPTYALTQIFGPWIGYFVWRMALLAIIVTAFYVAAKKFNAPRSQAAMFAGTLSASTVILSYLGNPYVTATALAAIAITLTAALFPGIKSAIIAGAAMGWLTMINPYAAILAGTLWLAVSLQRTQANKQTQGIALLLKQGAVAAAATITTFIIFLLLGTQLFPGKKWLQTYIDWNSQMDYSVFTSDTAVWLSDPSLLVPLAMLVIVIFQWFRHKDSATQAALTIGLTTMGVTLVFRPAMASITLESTTYTSMLWIPMSIAFLLSFTTEKPVKSWIPPLAIAVVAASGFINTDFNEQFAIAIAIAISVLVLATTTTRVKLLTLVIFLAASQQIQNSRDQIGTYYSSPFVWAYQENPIKLQLANSFKAQDWLINNTTSEDQILTYVDGDWLAGDRDLYVAASLQFWGENRISVTPELRPEDLQRLEELRPNVFALYGSDKNRLQQYADDLPDGDQLSQLECIDFDWPGSLNGATLCLTRLDTYLGSKEPGS
jgi:hypothetical protein